MQGVRFSQQGPLSGTTESPGRSPQRSVQLTHLVAAEYCDPRMLMGLGGRQRVNQAGLGLTSQKEVNHHVLKGNPGSPGEVQDVAGSS